jgi:hypothetical protein
MTWGFCVTGGCFFLWAIFSARDRPFQAVNDDEMMSDFLKITYLSEDQVTKKWTGELFFLYGSCDLICLDKHDTIDVSDLSLK